MRRHLGQGGVMDEEPKDLNDEQWDAMRSVRKNEEQ